MDSPATGKRGLRLRSESVHVAGADRELHPPPAWMTGLRRGLIVLALLYALIAGLKTVVDFDLGWQMATGRYLLQHHAVPRTDVFSYTARGVEWIYPVLSGIVFYLLHQVGGYAAISWLCALACVGCTAVLIYRRSLGAIVLAVLAVPVLASETLPRASLFTMLLFTCFARILLEHFEDRRAPLWLLAPLMVLWVNLHTGFVAGIALIAAYLIVEALETPFPLRRQAAIARVRRAAPWLTAAVAATILNPWGTRIFAAVARQQAVTQQQSAFLEEWAPVKAADALQELGWRDPESAHWWLLAFGVVMALICLWRRRLGPALVLFAAAYAFVRHQRMEGPCIVVLCLIGGSAISSAASLNLSLWRRKTLAIGAASLLTILVAVRCFDLITNRTYISSGAITLFGSGPSWWLPKNATDFLLQHHLPGEVFSNFNLSSYLVWQLGQQYPDFADGRYIPFGERLFDEQRTLTSLPLDSPEWTRAADTNHINTVIFPISRIFALGEFPLLADCQSKQWTPIYLDTTAIIFQRNNPGPRPPSIDCNKQNLLPSAEPDGNSYRQRAERYQIFANASGIYSLLGRFNEADEAANLASAIYPNDPTLLLIRAQTALDLKQYDESEQELQAAINLKQTDAVWYDLALLYINEHRYPEAVEALQKSAHFSREDYERHLLIGKILLAEQQSQQALNALSEAAHESPYRESATSAAVEFNAQIAEAQAAAYMQMKQPERAVELQRLAVRLTPESVQRKKVLADDCQAAGITCSIP
ncbi:M48 family metallopeptidase [Granulicella sp. L60]|uniref:tetratricopeptide repeat protein n=1 Tax=Granulicella sp. L60 TaxID=1641866 RepID=UPI00131AD475|nr:tetratricopeptide repeat protein [Granulicella sp. L60]